MQPYLMDTIISCHAIYLVVTQSSLLLLIFVDMILLSRVSMIVFMIMIIEELISFISVDIDPLKFMFVIAFMLCVTVFLAFIPLTGNTFRLAHLLH